MQNWRISGPSFTICLIAVLGVQLVAVPVLLDHRSTDPMVFGLYSRAYAVLIAVDLALIVGWCAVVVLRTRVHSLLMGLTLRRRAIIVLLLAGGMIGVGLAPIEPRAKAALALHGLGAALLLIAAAPRAPVHSPVTTRRVTMAIALVAVVCAAVALAHALVSLPFSPDEAHWADYALTSQCCGGLYARTWMQHPYPIYPGLGWSVAVYGWMLDNLVLDIRTGRVWTFAVNVIAALGTAAAARALYGGRAGAIAALALVTSAAVFTAFEYRAHFQVTPVVAWTAFALFRWRQTGRTRFALLAGLLPAFGLQLHAIALVVSGAAGLVMVIGAIPRWRTQVRGLLAFAVGMGFGAMVYFLANVLPNGGLLNFLSVLSREHNLTRPPLLWFTHLPALTDAVLVGGALLFIVVRRSKSDRMLLILLACMAIGMTLIDTQGYLSPMMPLYAIMIGGLADGLFPDRRRSLAAVALSAALIGALIGRVDGGAIIRAVRDGLPTYDYAVIGSALAPYLNDDDVILGTHLLIWSMADRPLYTSSAEPTAMRFLGLESPLAVWERVRPTVILDIPGQMQLESGAQTYIARYGFTVCDTVGVGALTVRLMRADCAS